MLLRVAEDFPIEQQATCPLIAETGCRISGALLLTIPCARPGAVKTLRDSFAPRGTAFEQCRVERRLRPFSILDQTAGRA